MRKRLKWLVVLGAAFVVLLASLPFLVSPQSIQRDLSSRVKTLTGLQLNHPREINLKFLPYLGVELGDVQLTANSEDGTNDPVISIDLLSMKLEVLALLGGEIRFKDFVLTRPIVHGNLMKPGAGDAPVSKSAIAKAVNSIREKNVQGTDEELPADLEDFGIGSFQIVDGEVVFGANENNNLSDINGDFHWASALSSFRTNVTGVWRGEVVNASASFDRPLELLAGRNSQSEILISSSLIDLNFEGTGSFIAGLVANGNYRVNTPDAVSLLAKLDERLSIPFSVGALSMSGGIVASGDDAQLKDTVLTINEDNATGNLQLNAIGSSKFRLSGTMAFESLNLTRLAEASGLPGSGQQNVLGLDLRFSAPSANLGALDITELAATLVSSDENWELEIGDGTLFGGRIMGKLNATMEEGKARQTISGSFSQLDLQPLIQNWHDEGLHISGKGDANFELHANVEAGWPTFSQWSGNVQLKVKEGNLEGLDLVQISTDLGRENGFLSSSQISGTTSFSEMEADMTVFRGISWITRGKVNMEQGHASLYGKIDMAGGGLAMNAVLFGQTQSDEQSVQPRFFIGGTLKNSLITDAFSDRAIEEGISTGQ